MGRALGYSHWPGRFSHKEKTKGEPKFRKKKIHLVWNIPKAIHAVFGTSIPPSCQKSAFQSLWPDFQSTCRLFVLLTSTGIECSAHPKVFLGLVYLGMCLENGSLQFVIRTYKKLGWKFSLFSVIILIRQPLELRTMTLWVPTRF